MPVPKGDIYKWDPKSTYIKLPPYFDNMPKTPPALADIHAPRCWRFLATASPPITFRRLFDSRGFARGEIPDRQRREAA